MLIQSTLICSAENIKFSLFWRILEPLTKRTQAPNHVFRNSLSTATLAPLPESSNPWNEASLVCLRPRSGLLSQLAKVAFAYCRMLCKGQNGWDLRARSFAITRVHCEFLEPVAPFIFGINQLIVCVQTSAMGCINTELLHKASIHPEWKCVNMQPLKSKRGLCSEKGLFTVPLVLN